MWIVRNISKGIGPKLLPREVLLYRSACPNHSSRESMTLEVDEHLPGNREMSLNSKRVREVLANSGKVGKTIRRELSGWFHIISHLSVCLSVLFML